MGMQVGQAGSETQQRFNRRQLLLMGGAIGAISLVGYFGLGRSREYMLRRSAVKMGTEINLILYGPNRDRCEAAADRALNRIEQLEEVLSRHRPTSELARLNREGKLQAASDDLLRVLTMAHEMSERTDGAFDVTVLPLLGLFHKKDDHWEVPRPEQVRQAMTLVGYKGIHVDGHRVEFARPGMGVTLDGIGKGYAVDQAVATLAAIGLTNVYVEAGGDLMVSGRKAGGEPWRIGIANPRPEHPESMVSVALSNQAVATSGDYMQAYTPDRKFHHIIDPRTGFSPPELASATIIAPTVAMADGLATAAMVLGHERATRIIDAMPGCAGFFIGKDLQHYRTHGFVG
jgi:thiamine biosynthesis lipoprotein